ncbi:BlaI/MecI/CopY family transcriptional regulator [Acutalibacter intestini]|uniref:BlaI/MecI/CopY family transcriptional regulator n=1 Tax=Acutalibacter intestini TaxID=3093659 RepID=UPI002AC9D68C|nr:BlaI/MecI/CopY family transcriptional regulator [Acutalibacter sp. M00204]
MERFVLSRTEEKVMTFLWEQGKPLSVPEMLELWDHTNKTWTVNYMRAILRSLEEKEAVRFHDLNRRGSQYARRFIPTYSKKEYYTELAKRSGVSISDIVRVEAVAMTQKGDKDGMDDLIRQLEAIIEEYRVKDDNT